MAAGRYAATPVLTTTVASGEGGEREVRYLGRRQLPDPRTTRPLSRHVITLADRLDLIAAEQLGDPLASWRIADANLALDPFELTGGEAEGEVLVIPFPEAAP